VNSISQRTNDKRTSAQALDQSKASGPHAFLAKLVGEWEGVTQTWFEPGKMADESPVRGTIRSILDGRFMLHEYEWSLMGESMQSVAIIGYSLDR